MTKLATRIVEKPWGVRGIDPRFGAEPGRQIGEIWFEREDGAQPLGVMAKYLFTSERLSIQVHPDEATAHARGLPHGKDECWIILNVAPGAELGIGTLRPMAPDELLDAARDGRIEQHIDWRPARRGQFIYNPAGTVHALGPGLTVLEIQQPYDVTYRLFDYGRPRPLHLEESRAVIDARPHAHPADGAIDEQASAVLVDGAFFGVAWCFREPPSLPSGSQYQLLPIDRPVSGGNTVALPGECHLLEGDPAALRSEGAFVLAWLPTSSPAR
ncbi:MAG: class I mannose-6-phosphate isomerase [Sphingomicrobium sp.]